ncbi:DUF58 domain-containing protein [Methanoculleus sp. FWC-SCC1]|uniref:DUF58 domain-containing protein n=1 Tax=Methanoculleus frigidifontis TaxID=2584085 RepID=A0ABT8MBM3_9EURY|nr:DUF58 domain-containing protein [Methanoculleus sp. FWC-SCC1]MDN7025342.1 DUF58 domain-containing protein [Methanoculleus sp. FWC-SCC1]
MQPTQNAQGFAIVALFLGAFALFLSDLPAMIAAATIGLFLAYRALTFTVGCRRFLAGITVTRETDRQVVRQGGAIAVESRITARSPDQMKVTIRDLLPALAASGDEPTYAPSPAGGWTAGYPVRFMATGETRFGGLWVTLTDPFYRQEIRCTRDDCREPHVQVIPPQTATAIEGGGSREGGRKDSDYLRVMKGQTVRSFRPYRAGDDPRDIDWKMAAKHDRLFAREMSGQRGSMPCIIADLPDLEVSEGSAAFGAFSAAVGGAVEGAVRSAGGCWLTLISGANVIRSFTPPEVLHQATTLPAVLHPVARHTHLYRMQNRSSLRAAARRLERLQQNPQAESSTYRQAMHRLYRTFPEGIARTPFEAQIRRALGEAGSDNVYLYTCRNGDTSHIDCVAREAALQGRHLSLWTPESRMRRYRHTPRGHRPRKEAP